MSFASRWPYVTITYMFIPRYSIRWLLGLMTFSAGVSLVLSYAVRGQAWAIGVTSGLWTLVVVALLFVAAFLAAWFIDQVAAGLRTRRHGESTELDRKPPTRGRGRRGINHVRCVQPLDSSCLVVRASARSMRRSGMSHVNATPT